MQAMQKCIVPQKYHPRWNWWGLKRIAPTARILVTNILPSNGWHNGWQPYEKREDLLVSYGKQLTHLLVKFAFSPGLEWTPLTTVFNWTWLPVRSYGRRCDIIQNYIKCCEIFMRWFISSTKLIHWNVRRRRQQLLDRSLIVQHRELTTARGTDTSSLFTTKRVITALHSLSGWVFIWPIALDMKHLRR